MGLSAVQSSKGKFSIKTLTLFITLSFLLVVETITVAHIEKPVNFPENALEQTKGGYS